jgi:methionyl-tRNA synthetase
VLGESLLLLLEARDENDQNVQNKGRFLFLQHKGKSDICRRYERMMVDLILFFLYILIILLPMPRFYLTTPIYYVNDKPHIGHAYSTFAADAFARYHRLRGDEVLFVTGTDENSQKNIDAMRKAGESDLQAYLNRMAGVWKTAWQDLSVSFDDFIRTTEPRHLAAVERFWNAAKTSGDIYLGTYEGLYCGGCEAFKTETDVVDGRCPLHPNAELQRISEQNYFFKLTNYREALLRLYDTKPDFILPDVRRNEIRSYVNEFLTDVSVSRSVKAVEAGIPVPGDPSQRIYVWFDALINYLSAIGYGSDDTRVKTWWPADTHLMAKDIIKFHGALWPAMLMSAAKSDPLLKELASQDRLLPRHVIAHGFFTMDGQKISKSLGNAIDPRELVPTYGLDAIRYFLLREIPFGEDGDFSRVRLEERYTADLANTLGNLVQRAVSMSRRYFQGNVPTTDPLRAGASPNGSSWDGASGFVEMTKAYDRAFALFRIDQALEGIWGMGAVRGSGMIQANKFIEDTKPFKLATSDAMKTGEILYAILEACRLYAWLLDPVMPNISRRIIEALGQRYADERAKGLTTLRAWGGLACGSALPEPAPLFPRLTPPEVQDDIKTAAF